MSHGRSLIRVIPKNGEIEDCHCWSNRSNSRAAVRSCPAEPPLVRDLLAASERSAGKTYGYALRDERTGAFEMGLDEKPLDYVLDIKVEDADKINAADYSVVFSATEADVAVELEPRFAKTTPVISTASAFRYDPDVPILVRSELRPSRDYQDAEEETGLERLHLSHTQLHHHRAGHDPEAALRQLRSRPRSHDLPSSPIRSRPLTRE